MPIVKQSLEGLTKKGTELNPCEDEYRRIVGSLMYLMIATRPDLANSIGIVSRYPSNPSEEHLMAAKHILRYVKGTKNYALTLGNADDQASFDIYGYTDADWGTDPNTQKSTMGYVFFA